MKFYGGLIMIGLGIAGWALEPRVHHPFPDYAVFIPTGLVVLGVIVATYGAFSRHLRDVRGRMT
jgi:hypothetical protein